MKEKLGQLAHLDRDPANGNEDNIAFLCLVHHSLYDAVPRQHKGYTADEVKAAQADLYKEVARRRRLAAGFPVVFDGVVRKSKNIAFVSYSRADAMWLERFQIHLAPLEHSGSLSLWADTKSLRPGENFKVAIKRAIESARIAILLVTPDFLESEFIRTFELPLLLERARRGALQLCWIAVRPSLYTETQLKDCQAVNDPKRALSGLRAAKADEQLVKIAEAIKSLVS